jgi:hypothetical protein
MAGIIADEESATTRSSERCRPWVTEVPRVVGVDRTWARAVDAFPSLGVTIESIDRAVISTAGRLIVGRTWLVLALRLSKWFGLGSRKSMRPMVITGC